MHKRTAHPTVCSFCIICCKRHVGDGDQSVLSRAGYIVFFFFLRLFGGAALARSQEIFGVRSHSARVCYRVVKLVAFFLYFCC